jgi:hypothetical protein
MSDDDDEHEESDQLPRRQRQASIAPQLRDTAPATAAEAATEPALDPNPASSRALVESLQYGWRRGRTDAEEADDAWPAETGQEHTVRPEDQEST